MTVVTCCKMRTGCPAGGPMLAPSPGSRPPKVAHFHYWPRWFNGLGGRTHRDKTSGSLPARCPFSWLETTSVDASHCPARESLPWGGSASRNAPAVASWPDLVGAGQSLVALPPEPGKFGCLWHHRQVQRRDPSSARRRRRSPLARPSLPTNRRKRGEKVRRPLMLSEVNVEKGKESDFETLPPLPSADKLCRSDRTLCMPVCTSAGSVLR